MGYSRTERWGRPIEIGAGFGINTTLTTTPSNIAVGTVQLPYASQLDNGEVIGAYMDVFIPSVSNDGGAANWILANAAYPKVTITPTGHGSFDAVSNLTLACFTVANGTYNYGRIYGDKNFASLFPTSSHYYGHVCEVQLYNCRAQVNNLYPENFIFVWRFYVR